MTDYPLQQHFSMINRRREVRSQRSRCTNTENVAPQKGKANFGSDVVDDARVSTFFLFIQPGCTLIHYMDCLQYCYISTCED